MKKTIIFLILIGFYLTSSSEEKIRLTSGEFEPLISEKYKNLGVVSHIVSEAFGNEGIQVEYGFSPWKRSLEMARAGTWDGSVMWIKTPDREKDFYLSKEPIFSGKYVFFHLKNSGFTWADVEGLRKYKLGTAIGYSYGAEFDSYVKAGKIKTEDVANDIQNIRKLLSGRIDAYILDLDVGRWLIRRNFSAEEQERIMSNEKPLLEVDTYLLLSKTSQKNSEMMDKFDRGFKKLKDSNKYDLYFTNSSKGLYEP